MSNAALNATAQDKDGPLPVSIVIGDELHALPLKRGEVRSERIAPDMVQVSPIHTSFKPMVRGLIYDVCEMAIVTYLMAKDRGEELTLLPAVMLGRKQHPLFIHNAARGAVRPSDLEGRRVGVRAYSQTTGAWMRGILGDEYGVDFKKVRWVTFEDAHVDGYREPEWVERAPAGKALIDMLVSGEIDAAIAEKTDDPQLQPVIPNADAAANDWSRKYGIVPVNHMVVIKTALVRQHPWLPAEVYDLLKRSKARAPALSKDGPDPMPFGVEANRKSLGLLARYAYDQGLVSRLYDAEEFFDETTRELN